MDKGKEYLPGDKELFDMMDARFQSAPEQVKPVVMPTRRKKRVWRAVKPACMTLLCLAATAFGYMEWWLGAIMTLACFCRTTRRIWRWRHG